MKVLEEMKAKAENANTERKTLMEELDTLRPLKVVVYLIPGVHVS